MLVESIYKNFTALAKWYKIILCIHYNMFICYNSICYQL